LFLNFTQQPEFQKCKCLFGNFRVKSGETNYDDNGDYDYEKTVKLYKEWGYRSTRS